MNRLRVFLVPFFLIVSSNTLLSKDTLHSSRTEPTKKATQKRSTSVKRLPRVSKKEQDRLAAERARVRAAIKKDFHKTVSSRPPVLKKVHTKMRKKFRRSHKRSSRSKITKHPIHARFSWPVPLDKFWVSSYYGPRTLRGQKGFHTGIDLAARTGTPVKAAGSGKVLEAGYARGYGNYIVLEHKDQYKTRYAHLYRILVKTGQRVRSAQLIGKVGSTGNVAKSKWGRSASHLHFEVYMNGKRINPVFVLA